MMKALTSKAELLNGQAYQPDGTVRGGLGERYTTHDFATRNHQNGTNVTRQSGDSWCSRNSVKEYQNV